MQGSASQIHGLISASEWGGVPLRALLEEAGVKPAAKWIIADGADAAVMARSVPLDKILDDAIVALYQNGERLRPSNGYPMRLFLPGWEGNMSVKWLRSIRVTATPAMTKDETSKYSDLNDDGIGTIRDDPFCGRFDARLFEQRSQWHTAPFAGRNQAMNLACGTLHGSWRDHAAAVAGAFEKLYARYGGISGQRFDIE